MNLSLRRRTILIFLPLVILLAAPCARGDVVVDNDQGAPAYVDSGDWLLSSWTGYNDGTYVYTSNDGVARHAVWTPGLASAGAYDVYTVFRRGSNRTADAPYTIRHAEGTANVSVDMRGSSDMAEVLLGRFQFNAGTNGWVRLDNNGGSGAYIADAVILRPASGEAAREYRVIWIDTWNTGILNATQCQDLINTCRANNINTIMPEVRKIGDAYYDSDLEPRATNISGGSTFDPLGYLIGLAHDTSGGKKRIEVHAWFVMQRISTSTTLPAGHVLLQHPEYVMYDSNGNEFANTTRYLDPGHPGAVDHNIAVILDCMSKYDIDGVNLDYIRYPEYSGSWGYNPVSVARFNAYYGKSGQPATNDPDWAAWRRECVTLHVRKLYVKMAKMRPSVILTADTVNWGSNYTNATWPSSDAYARVYQDWVGWLEDGILDYNALMNYSTSMSRFRGWTNLSLAHDHKRGSIIGIGAYLQSDIQNSMDQLLWARGQGPDGLNIYDWGSEVNNAPQTRSQFYSALRTQVYPTWADPPPATWKTNPTAGIIEGTVTAGGSVVDHAAVSIDGLAGFATVSDGSGWYGLIDVPPGTYTLRYAKSPYTTRTRTVGVTAGGILTQDVDLLESAGRATIETY